MRIKTVQWNIGGGKTRTPGNNPELAQSYSVEGLDHIISTLERSSPDIITLQETHADRVTVQAEIIANRLGLPYFFNDVYDQSHIEKGQGLGQAIISRFPIEDHSFTFFYNPHYEIERPDGTKWISHDKGVSAASIQSPDNTTFTIMTLHLIPFKKFGIDPLGEAASQVRKDIVDKIKKSSKSGRFLLQGDFNFDNESLASFLPDIFDGGTREIPTTFGTTPKGKRYDHIVFKGLEPLGLTIDSTALTDHYPLLAEFEV
jgi:endonuclease/exonuclease/phosphatase (EEP) superfamily protein YafD